MLRAFINSNTKINLINQHFVIQWNLSQINVNLSLSRFLNENARHCYDVYELIYWIIDFWKQNRKCTILLYSVNFTNLDLILKISIFAKHDILINSQTKSWRFKIQSKKLKISKSKNFVNIFESKHQIFVFVCVGVTATNKKINQKLHILKQMKNYKKFFDNEKIEMLFKQHDENHVINLMKDKKSLFMLLYNLA